MAKLYRGHLIAWLLCAALLAGVLPVRAAEAFPFVAYTTENQFLREGPSASSESLLTIAAGEAVAITGVDGDYYIAEYQSRAGYLEKRAVSTVVPAQTAASPQPADAAQSGKYPALTLGSEGPSVTALQQALQELGFYKGGLDGKYGKGTEQAVRDYQEKNKLNPTGLADSASQEKLFEGKPLNKAGKATEVKTLSALPGQTLRPGDRGELISQLQQQLKNLGFYTGKIDGVYGRGTEDAVREFQAKSNLKVDGKVGSQTAQALLTGGQPLPAASEAPAQDAAALPEPTQSPAFTTELGEATYPYQTVSTASVNLRKGSSTGTMRILTIPQGAQITVLESKGDFLKVTYKQYTGWAMADYISVPEQYLSGKSLKIDALARQHYETLGIGSTGDKVRSLQQALNELGYYKGTSDGVFAAGTLAATKALQEKNGLRATGVASPELQQLIYEQRVRNEAGKNVYLKLLPPIPGWPMQQGDMGEAVTQLNRGLIELGHLSGSASNEYTAKTTAAVKAFQKAHSIKQTGKVDEFTLLAFNTALGITAQPTPQPGAQQQAEPEAPSYVTLRNGTRGVAVTQLQTRLVSLGYDLPTPDGVFGDQTEKAVKAFQMRNQLLVNGIADYATQQALYAATAIPSDTTAVLPGQDALQETLRIGSVGSAVVQLQSRLITLNYLKGTADGIFGTQTAQAVTAFQKKSGLTADGVAGSSTLGALYASNAESNAASAQVNPSQEEDSAGQSTSLRVGDRGPAVKALQNRLIELKYLTGGADGVFGPATYLALQNFQSNNKLSSDGVAGKQTMAKLADPKAIAATGLSEPAPSQPAAPATPVFTAPRASEVRNGNWEAEVRARLRSMPNVIVYDFMSGAHYNVHVFSLGKHADGEPPTAEDTRIMENALGVNNWTPRPVWIIFSDGRVYMASTHSHGHEVDHNANNNLAGHICIHFPREMSLAEAVGPYAVSHQQAILMGWDLTQSMAR